MECYPTIRKKKILPFATYMDLEDIMPCGGKSEKDNYSMIFLRSEI